MWAVWLVSGGAVVAFLATVLLFRLDFRNAARGWQLLAVSGLVLGLGGLGFAVRFWEPTPGPYRANALYPLGPYLNTWVVSFGFTWMAFGLLFIALALVGARHPSRRLWLALFASWALCWLPHGVIGVGFAFAGHNDPSIQFYQDWAASVRGLVALLSSSFVLLVHFAGSVIGFLLTGHQLWRARDTSNSLEPATR